MPAKNENRRVIEFSLVSIELDGIPERKLALARRIGQLDLVWPRAGIARKSAAREMKFRKGKAEFLAEPWTKRCVFREEVDGHCGIAVSVTESITVQKLRRFARLTAKYALKMGADFMEKAMTGYADIASAPIDAVAAMVGEKDAPAAIAQGVTDLETIPGAGEETLVAVPLARAVGGKPAGRAIISVKG